MDEAISNAQIASGLFAKSHNIAGDLWARFAEVYAYQRQQSGAACLDAAAKLDQRLKNTTYHWLQGHLALEKAVCRNFAGDLNEAEIDADLGNGRYVATRFGFPILHFRILGIAPGIRRQHSATCEQTWGEELEGLEEYWKGVYPRERLYQFYSVLAQCAEQEGHWNEAKALVDWMIEMRLGMDTKHQDLNVLGALYLHLASILTSLRDNAGAERAAAQAEAIFDKVPGPNQYKLITKIILAECQLKLGKAQAALATLEPARVLLKSTDNKLVLIDFRRVMGKIRLQLGQLADAEQEYKSGLEIAEGSLSTLKHADQRIEWAGKTEELYRGLVQIWLEQKRVVDAWKLWEWSKTRSMYEEQLSRDSETSARTWQKLERTILALPVPSEPEVRIVYAVFANRLHVWTVGGNQVRSKWIEVKQEKLEGLVEDFARKCADESSSLTGLQEEGKELFVLLVQPFIRELSEKQIVAFEVDQELWRLPVQALRTPDGQYLAEKYAIAYSPGILVEKKLRKAARIRGQNALLQVEALPGFGTELDRISGRFIKPTVLNGAAASSTEVLEATRRSDILFFFGHALPKGRGAALTLSDESSLNAVDFVPGILSHLSLVVLAACSTGSTGEYGLVDTHSLVHAFLAGRVPDVVASQ
ncbi:MAG: CHAT domain-containing protein, partial [Candidatus Angelobacter sp.]